MNKWIVAIVVMLPTLIEIIDSSVVNVSLGHIRGSLSAGVDEATWAITSYLVANAIIIPLTGWLSRLFGRKLYLLISLTLFTVSSLFCGMAWSLQSLIVFRILQGLGGGSLQPLSLSILLETFPPRQHGIAVAFFGIGIMLGPVIGPIFGGWVTDTWSWHWIFFINGPIGLLSIVLTMLVIHDPPHMKRMRIPIDYMGLALVTVGIGCLQIVLDKGEREAWFQSSLIIWLSIAAVAALAAFIFVELKTKSPVVDLRSFNNRSFSAGNVIMFSTFFVLFGTIILLPIYLQTLMGYTATLAGLALSPGGLATALALQVSGRLINKVNPKALILAGIVTIAYSVYQMSQFNLNADLISVMWPRFVFGLGMGLIFVPMNNVILSSVPKEGMANAVALYSLIRNLGGSFGVAIATTLLSRSAQFNQAWLVTRLNVFDPAYQIALEKARTFLHLKGLSGVLADKGALGLIYQSLVRQASMRAFNESFLILAIMMVCLAPLVFILRRGKDIDAGPP